MHKNSLMITDDSSENVLSAEVPFHDSQTLLVNRSRESFGTSPVDRRLRDEVLQSDDRAMTER